MRDLVLVRTLRNGILDSKMVLVACVVASIAEMSLPLIEVDENKRNFNTALFWKRN